MLSSLLLALASGAAPCSGLPPGDAHFLIVGRNVPPTASGLAPLEYADDDARAMRSVAIDPMCFRPDQVQVLVGEDATVDNVLAAIAAHPEGSLGRLFVYVSAHGSQGEGLQLDRPLPWQRLDEAIRAVDARQTFVFLDTCDSATFAERRAGSAKGTVQIAPLVDEGRFHLAASTGRAFERHWLRGGVATHDFISMVFGYGSPADARTISSSDICRILKHHPSLAGECQQEIKGSEGVILVPERRPPGWLQVEEGARAGQWSYLLGARRGGEEVWFPIRSIDLGGAPARRSDGLPPGEYRLRRIHSDRRRCDVAGVTIEPGEIATVSPPAWVAEPAHCAWIEERERHVPARPSHGIGVAVGLASPWIASTRTSPSLRLDYQDATVLGYRAGVGLAVTWFPADVDVEPASARYGAVDVAGSLFWDPLFVSLGALDVYGGVEGGGGVSRVEGGQAGYPRWGATGMGAVRLGAALRISSAWLLDITTFAGVRTYRWLGEYEASPWGGVSIGAILGLD